MKIWIATGGTGGHVYPALSVAECLAARGHRITISCDGRVRDMVRRGAPNGARMVHVWASGVGAKSRINQIWALTKIAVSAFALTLRFMFCRPDRVVAFGGYASVPAVFAAHVWRIPTFLHEQNAAIGRANKFAMRWVQTLMTSFPTVSGIPNSTTRVVYTGLPVRRDFLAAAGTPLPNASKLLITGGSLGAQILDDVVPTAVAAMKNKKIFITHQTRPENVARLQKFYADNKIRANVLSFIHDMAGAIAGADLVIGRSGASTVVELQTIGRPAIFVPLGINPDQAANAASFAKNGGGFAIAQSQFTPKWLTATLTELFDNPSRLDKMAKKALVPNNAVDLIADEITK
ncbi:MAG: UDP-N-acetylglucosamine--N-acetylmuramyl-(pentapeptide) pyrophosphoryl-undecaprenol N-acetylglucosamine transferase [Alphaproteobacteria bacterium]|nr:UDP-N-acetylglucosamine--N-acetylmuramyl-(pentapeptide) pyrophosphoryl-undecaprenol N-acetylglucosamine transferase [Alphaproteobacteria bacterium]MBQ4130146.1 UDP-N-acetylglucosamine--N-acetylmuramyl-(pentapeptide) pyrophosphoryl-undecaprenol N-acetylglucosamine transferase [Alphaproteobacteria bacterium]MBR5567105.1 UDP-N-acetylglucosamine--N-acetylmuramyl-(pentapeptide) pyrophosphoryl-undecaprenol N-acetylglucosamine transferase [Alphaproteobacteria bacterium]